MASLLALFKELLDEICLLVEGEDLQRLRAVNYRLLQVSQRIRLLQEKFSCFQSAKCPSRWLWHNLTCSTFSSTAGKSFVDHIAWSNYNNSHTDPRFHNRNHLSSPCKSKLVLKGRMNVIVMVLGYTSIVTRQFRTGISTPIHLSKFHPHLVSRMIWHD
ncbi:hypothetical protein M501DRAFT_219432 [Patellaria atrata CBS 101060]|uniref:Uncharacterized protein n=1 Tax=Patellaria atrata CBS 101060 TaxID=1346257 RepID=A0A9P4S8E5_9PEZI|nr:hypothetical protein M501DRAFT_219432 [Patellaria atrata CBS 101060]